MGRQLVAALLVPVLLTSGCATNTLWHAQQYHPADHPDLRLSVDEQSRDLLVEYKEQRGEEGRLHERAYWLFASTNSMTQGGQPIFVSPRASSELVPVPLLETSPGTYGVPRAGYVAVATPAEQGFELYLNGHWLGRYNLPVYMVEPRTTPWRVMATPIAAMGDTAVIIVVCVVVVGVAVGVLYLESKAH